MKIAIVTDAWHPQVNGVVRTLESTVSTLRAMGHEAEVFGPDRFQSMPCPHYPEIRLAVMPDRKLTRMLDAYDFDALHIATECVLGLSARSYAAKRRIPFTTAYHTQFPQYLKRYVMLPERVGYAAMRRFHSPADAVLVPTPTVMNDLKVRGFTNLKMWARGVDTNVFRPAASQAERDFLNLPRPISLYAGRVSVEKNIEAFLKLDLPGTKMVVGDGPELERLRRDYPAVHFAGYQFGKDLARHYTAADAFIFPSRTDTFGLVLLEALACGVPVAAYPVTGPRDVLVGAAVGVLDEDLGRAARAILEAKIPPEVCRAHAMNYSWEAATAQFVDAQVVRSRVVARAA